MMRHRVRGYCQPMLFCVLLIILCSTAYPASVAQAAPMGEEINQRHFVYLPLVLQGVAAQAPSQPACDLNAEEKALELLFRTDPSQRRTIQRCDSILSEIARQRAADMADRDYFGHVNPDGLGPNYLVRQAGYPLPSYYSRAKDGNNIESIGAGFAEAEDLWMRWQGSPGHREHVLGLQNFYQTQIEYGIGYVVREDSTYKRYWVLISAKREP